MNLEQLLIGTPLFENVGLTVVAVLVTFVIGIFAGSVLVCMGWRIGHGQDRIVGHSHCDHCGHALSLRDQIPLLSWLLLRGHCRYCGRPIGKREPLGELLVGTIYVTIVLRYGIGAEALELILLASALVVCAVASLYNYTVPNGAIAFAAVVRLIYVAGLYIYGDADVSPLVVGCDSLLGAFIMGGMCLGVAILTDHLTGRETPGTGDAKLMAIAGLYFGWQHAVLLLALSGAIALFVSIVSHIFSRSRFEVEDYDPEDADYAPDQYADAEQQLAEELAMVSAGQTVVLSAKDIERAARARQKKDEGRHGAELAPDLSVRARRFGPGNLDFGVSLNAIPFAPSITMAFWLVILMGAPVLGWSMAIF